MVASSSRTRGFALVSLTYLVALSIAVAVGYALSGYSLIITALAVDVAATLVVYLAGRLARNASFYDPYWSVAPIVMAIYWLAISISNPGWQQYIMLGLVAVWGVRLTWNWARGWRGSGHEDWRYTELRRKSGGWFWLVELLGIDLMPTAVVFLGCLPLYAVLTSAPHSFGVLDILAVIITAGAITIEAVSDIQLRRFLKGKRRTSGVMQSGLWAYIRHPNYLGEVGFWWGLYLFGLAAGANWWWTGIGALSITALFVFISVPMMDRHMAERHPEYDSLRGNVPALLPRF